MFHLNKAVLTWKKSLRNNPSLEDGYIEELESHLRDKIDAYVNKGMSEEEAFKKAKEGIGNAKKISAEYFKTDTKHIRGKRSRQAPKWIPVLVWNYLKTGMRVIKRYKGYSFINIFGLAVGITSCILILLYILNETSYDKFYKNSDDIYRVAVERKFPNQKLKSAATERPLAKYLKDNLPGVIEATRISKERADKMVIKYKDKSFYEDKFILADQNVFKVFSIPFIEGNPDLALSSPFSVVLSKKTATKYFGNQDPVGKVLKLKFKGGNEFYDYKITGIIADQNYNSHFHYDFIASYKNHPYVGEERDQDNWNGLNLYTYLLLQHNVDVNQFDKRLNNVVKEKMFPVIQRKPGISITEPEQAKNYYSFFLQPLKSIHLHSDLYGEIEPNGDIYYVYLFGIIGVIIMLLASINFINLLTARSSTRLKEIGIRKAMGSQRKQLIGQFLIESLIFSAVSLTLSFIITFELLPVINSNANLNLSFNLIYNPLILTGLIVFVVLTGLLSYLYPAVYLSSINPASIFKGGALKGNTTAKSIRNGLVLFQFVLSISLIICTLIIAKQNEYLRNKKLGFDKEHVLVIDGTESILRNRSGFLKVAANDPRIQNVSNGQAVPGKQIGTTQLSVEGNQGAGSVSTNWITVGFNYITTLGLKLDKGRDFSKDFAGDSMAVILNEKAVAALNLKEPIGKKIIYEERSYTVIGVAKDFNFSSLHKKITPMAIFGPDPFNQNRPNQIMVVRMKPGDILSTINFLKKTWQKFSSGELFRYHFLNEDLNKLYKNDLVARNLFSFFTFIAILIACFGLFGLAAFSARQRSKEIATRKVLGATSFQMVLLLTNDFIKLITGAFIIASILSFFTMQQWLNGYAFHTTITYSLFVVAGVISIFLILLTVGYQAIKAASSNPVKYLRYE